MSDIQSSPSPSCPGVGINGTLVADLPQSLGQAWERTAESDACGHGDVKILEPLFEGHLQMFRKVLCLRFGNPDSCQFARTRASSANMANWKNVFASPTSANLC